MSENLAKYYVRNCSYPENIEQYGTNEIYYAN